VWLGGGGVGKTHTLRKVVQPLAQTFFGPDGYSAAAQSNQAAQNLGSRGRTLHAANGLLMIDSLQTARLRLNAQTQRKMDRLVGTLGVDVIDELGCVPGDLLHADALRKTYGRCQRYDLDTTKYMQPSETWGRVPVKILSGDFYQLPPVPATASLVAPPLGQSYEHQQGRKLLLDMEYVVNFVQMQRFSDPLLVELLTAMRTPGGKKISEAAWQALQARILKQGQCIGATPPDARLQEARGWYECAYEWRIVSYAIHAHARLNAKAAEKLLFYQSCAWSGRTMTRCVPCPTSARHRSSSASCHCVLAWKSSSRSPTCRRRLCEELRRKLLELNASPASRLWLGVPLLHLTDACYSK